MLRPLLSSFAFIATGLMPLSAATIVTIDDFTTGIGASGDTPSDALGPFEALIVDAADSADTNPSGVTVPITFNGTQVATSTRTASLSVSATGNKSALAFHTSTNRLSISVDDEATGQFSHEYEFSPAGFDATFGGLVDTVEFTLASVDKPDSGTLSVTFVDSASNVGTWTGADLLQIGTGATKSAEFSSIPGGVDFTSLETVTFALSDGTAIDATFESFQFSGPDVVIPEPSSAMLLLLGSVLLGARRRR